MFACVRVCTCVCVYVCYLNHNLFGVLLIKIVICIDMCLSDILIGMSELNLMHQKNQKICMCLFSNASGNMNHDSKSYAKIIRFEYMTYSVGQIVEI